MSNFPVGLNYAKVIRRQGLIGNYEIVLRNNVVINNFTLLTEIRKSEQVTFVQTQVRQFGQIISQQNFQSEVYIFQLLENKSVYDMCWDFAITPIKINGVEYSGDEIEIMFEDIVGIYPSSDNPEFSLIYACTNPIQKQTPVIYEVGYSVLELWDYIKTCSFDSV